MMTTRLMLAMALACAVACTPPPAGQTQDAGMGPDASMTAGMDGGTQACATQVLPLLTRAYGTTERYFVEVVEGNQVKALQLDTGSALTFVFTGAGTPDFTPNAAGLLLGCEVLQLPGRGYAAPNTQVAGLDVIGLLGMEYLLARPTRLDVLGRQLEVLSHLPVDLPQNPDARRIPLDNVQQHALVPCTLDGDAVRLMFDTGGGHTLRVGVPGRPGDRESQVVDAQGTVFTIYEGTGTLQCGAFGPMEVPVARAPAFPYFEDTVAALGGNLHGLLGVSSFPGQQFFVDGAGSAMWTVPAP